MNTNYKNIFSQSDCLSQQQIEDYVADKLNRQEKYSVEQHLSDCPMCRDEAEGLENISDRIKLDETVTQLNQKIDSRIKRGSGNTVFRIKKNPDFRIKRILTIAAVLILFLGIGIIIRNSMQKIYSPETAALTKNKNVEAFKNQSVEQNKTETKLLSENNIAEKEKTILKGNNIKTVYKNTTNKQENIPQNDNLAVSEKSYAITTDAKEETIINDESAKNATNTEEEIVLNKSAETKDSGVSNDYATRLVFDDKSKKSSSNVGSSNSSDNSPITESVPKNEFKKSDSDNIETAGNVFLEAKDLYDSGKYEEALPKFQKAQTMNDSRVSDDAQWFEAMSLLKLDKKFKARKIFEKISNSSSYYKEQAVDKLKEIK